MTGVVNPELCKIAQSLLKIPSSSASIERIFSNFGFVQNNLRNKLGVSKCAKNYTLLSYVKGKRRH